MRVSVCVCVFVCFPSHVRSKCQIFQMNVVLLPGAYRLCVSLATQFIDYPLVKLSTREAKGHTVMASGPKHSD